MQRTMSSIVLLLMLCSSTYKLRAIGAEVSDQSPLGVIERLHQAMRDADAKTADLLLHAKYQGLSLQGTKQSRHVFVDTRDRAGLAHVWARYVFLYKGALRETRRLRLAAQQKAWQSSRPTPERKY